MDNEKILNKAIKIAKRNGWKPSTYLSNYEHFSYHDTEYGAPAGWFDYEDSLELNTVIFNHDFAKALWGEELEYVYINRGGGKPLEESLPRYKFHLQQMVISNDPIKYLGENMPVGLKAYEDMSQGEQEATDIYNRT